MNKQSIQNQTISYLSKNLSPKLLFHNVEHTQWVLNEVTSIANYSQCSSRTLELLQIAAICHDVGYTIKVERNEREGAQYAEEIMSKQKFPLEEINKVKSWILETNIELTPTSKESALLRDADSGYIGTNIFGQWSERLYQEYVTYGFISGDRKEWNLKQISFFESHEFFSSFSRMYRQPLKLKNLNSLKEKLGFE